MAYNAATYRRPCHRCARTRAHRHRDQAEQLYESPYQAGQALTAGEEGTGESTACIRWLSPPDTSLGHRDGDRVPAEAGHRVPEVVQEQGGRGPAHAEAGHDALDRAVETAPVRVQAGTCQPRLRSPVGQVDQGVAGIPAFADPPGDRPDAGGRVAALYSGDRSRSAGVRDARTAVRGR